MPALQSPRFAGDPILEACLNGQHRMLAPETGEAVKKVQRALHDLGFPLGLTFASGDADGKYLDETAQAVSAFKRGKGIEPSDGVVGPKTMAALDALFPPAPTPLPPPPPPAPTKQQVIQDAFQRSRASLQVVLNLMQLFEANIDQAARLGSLAINLLGVTDARNIAVISDKLRTSKDPLSPEFREALKKARELVSRNLGESSNIIDQGNTGRCDPSQFSPPGVPFASTRMTDPDPRVSVCTPFFGQNEEMKRDVITHEFFHLLGLADVTSIGNTADALNDANTMAQIVAYLHDRFRQKDSSGLSQPSAPYPMP